MWPFEHVKNLVGWHLAHDPYPEASKYEHWVPIQAMWNCLSQADIQNLFDSMLHRILALIAAHSCYIKH